MLFLKKLWKCKIFNLQVVIKNNSCLSLNLNNFIIYLEQNSINGKTLITLDKWTIVNNIVCNNFIDKDSSIILNSNQTITLFFVLKPRIGQEFFQEILKQQNRAQSPSSGTKNIQMDICVSIKTKHGLSCTGFFQARKFVFFGKSRGFRVLSWKPGHSKIKPRNRAHKPSNFYFLVILLV